jgi:hypothetical protein
MISYYNKNMRHTKKTIVTFILFVCLFFLPHKAFAHFLAVDSSVSAYLHIDPDDDPIAGQPTKLYFLTITDSNKKMDLKNCDCQVTIKQDDKTLFSAPLVKSTNKNSLDAGSVGYTFPEQGVYTIQFTGKPMNGTKLHSFDLSWDFRVNHGTTQQQRQTIPLQYVVVFGIILAIIIIYCIKRFS